MKHILPFVTSVGPTVGVVICLSVFIGVLFWVYRPGARRFFEEAGKMPLEDGEVKN
jgi:cbb3-type cytochrome oxidase subunit 3